ncbi:MAG TPA: 2OG-Fe(II) oxygenase [Polyangia bacterium]|jgi:hypothetical protein|nr:2OG-Fe(II) oxygenase [Polyangia bacterium]
MENSETIILHHDPPIFMLESALPGRICEELIHRAEARQFAPAPVNTNRSLLLYPALHNLTRVVLEDPKLAAGLWRRLGRGVPRHWGPWRAQGLNERLRFFRYEPGQYYLWHQDSPFRRSDKEQSLLTVLIYLNDDFTGGATEFDGGYRVVPQRGMALVFEHGWMHQGCPVMQGRKYILRTDVMYQRV